MTASEGVGCCRASSGDNLEIGFGFKDASESSTSCIGAEALVIDAVLSPVFPRWPHALKLEAIIKAAMGIQTGFFNMSNLSVEKVGNG